MATKPVQISLDRELLERIDRDPEARQKGRSAFIRSAVEIYLAAKRQQEMDSKLRHSYSGAADALLAEIADLLDRQLSPLA